jgi:hypothetical protein
MLPVTSEDALMRTASTFPPSSAVVISAFPLNGTIVTSTPYSSWSRWSSMPCGVEAPGVPTVSVPGFCSASAKKSSAVAYGEFAPTARTEGTSDITPIGVTSSLV